MTGKEFNGFPNSLVDTASTELKLQVKIAVCGEVSLHQ